tara:strand:- start:54 stop:857 length:804 start_codon:yes stop_codon:yes gene_type:complete
VFGNKKKYYFLSGLPRSGNTLLGSILNQNKQIAVTANSPVAGIFYGVENYKNDAILQNFQDHGSLDNVNNNLLLNYYSNWKEKYIIDRGPWGTPHNLSLLKKHCPNEIKIVVLVRNLYEIFASYLRWAELNPGNFLDSYETKEEKCDHLMTENGLLMKQLQSLDNLLTAENKDHYLIVKYNDLVEDTSTKVKEIYEFLNIPFYKHSFENLKQFKCNGLKYNDECLGLNLHRVRKSISKDDYDISEYVPISTMEKYVKYHSHFLNGWW